MNRPLTRREMVRRSIVFPAAALALPRLIGRELFAAPAAGETVIPFSAPQPRNPNRPMIQWEELTAWQTPGEQLFSVSHYGKPKFDQALWKLDVAGLVRRPKTLTLDELRSRPRKEIIATLECSGNGSSPAFMGAVGNMAWAGTPLAPLLKECGLLEDGKEIVFFGADQGKEKIRDNEYVQNFGRSLSREEAMRSDILLAWEMNGQPLTLDHGAPLRLVVPGWYGVAWVKWLTRIEVRDRRFMGKFMARDYVTIRGERREGETSWTESSVGPMNVKSIVARAVRLPGGNVRVEGAAWTDGTPLARVELKINDGEWRPVQLKAHDGGRYAWSFWSSEWRSPEPGEHTLVSRAIDRKGRVQPASSEPPIELKKTYWEAYQQVTRKLKV